MTVIISEKAAKGKPEFATAKIRFCAFTIDYALFFAASILCVYFVVFFNVFVLEIGLGQEKSIHANYDMLSIWIDLVILSIFFTCSSSKWQATPGQRMLGIYVSSRGPEKISTLRLFIRFSIFMATIIIFNIVFFLINSKAMIGFQHGFLISLFTMLQIRVFYSVITSPEKTAFYDIICNTRVRYGRL